MSAARRLDADRELVQERTFDAPVELVCKAFTDEKHLDQCRDRDLMRNVFATAPGTLPQRRL